MPFARIRSVLEVHSDRVLRQSPAGPLRPLDKNDCFRVAKRFTEAGTTELIRVFQAIEIEVIRADKFPAIFGQTVGTDKYKGGAQNAPAHPERPQEPAGKDGLPGSQFPRKRDHDGAPSWSFPQNVPRKQARREFCSARRTTYMDRIVTPWH
ncbi:MAG: hypothetical protein A2128_00385 [Candidatus Liptonbacteria bacterium GWC1_60_9]|uniref:Uncharacterized protein n=3 Tax=Candidatus Liptoniibacteriota TaxID=1817909 RepID=A0A1G2CNU2_9BACT|nr:MAG: hypothetical protein A2128_00385 [Candidatus Liptonbacteria bacterium GWC1_60_9]OGZ00050.1 MAG: hypothetical protein A3E09_01265 [Candidatus Liptonbacteria bacterium RIFCSPHIGHO2_12_FULL_60_13]OGZ02311.1 MAG: hypothetical protein A3G64_02415 [Candidatus Liptonbacteria bacterium RIFCSPLOWO2_12_FULL_60_15]